MNPIYNDSNCSMQSNPQLSVPNCFSNVNGFKASTQNSDKSQNVNQANKFKQNFSHKVRLAKSFNVTKRDTANQNAYTAWKKSKTKF